MQIEAQYSHLNGLEYMLVHHCALWDEIQDVIARVDAEACKTKVSKERTMPGKLLYSPGDMNKANSRSTLRRAALDGAPAIRSG